MDLHLFCCDEEVQCYSWILSGEFHFLKCALHGPCRCLFKLSIHSTVCFLYLCKQGCSAWFQWELHKMFMNTSNHSFPPQERRCRKVQGVATYKGESIQATREFGWFWWNCTKRTASLFSTRCHVNVRTDGKPCPFHNRRHLIFWNGTTLSNFAHWF